MLCQDFKKFILLMLFFSTGLTASHVELFDDQTFSSVKRTHENVSFDPAKKRTCCQNDYTTEEALQSRIHAEATGYEFYNLPSELLQEIFLYLDTSALKSCRLVSQLFAALVLDIQSRSTSSPILELLTMSDFTAYLSHNRQYSLQSISIAFAIDDKTMLIERDLSHIRLLHSYSDTLGNIGVRALAQSNLINLKKLSLAENDIDDEGATALANANLTNLTKLNLEQNEISSEGITAMAQGNLSNLTNLNIRCNFICDVGAIALANGNLTNLIKLNLSDNSIGNKGATALVNGKLTNLTILNLQSNQVSSNTARSLAQQKIGVYIFSSIDYQVGLLKK